MAMGMTRLMTESVRWAVGAALLVACSGEIGSSGGGPGGNGGPSGGGQPNGGAPGGGAPGGGGAPAGARLLHPPPAPPPTNGLHKLAAWEFANSLQNLRGIDVPLSAVAVDTRIGCFATVRAS